MKRQLQERLQQRVDHYTMNPQQLVDGKEKQYQQLLADRDSKIVRAHGAGKIFSIEKNPPETFVVYEVQLQFLIKQKDHFFMEEKLEERLAVFRDGKVVKDEEMEVNRSHLNERFVVSEDRLSYTYDRRSAVQYADRWWNEFNPAYPKFDDDCTNYISQCLHAGKIPMWGSPNRSKGWWMSGKSWSYSWTTAHGFYLLLASNSGIKTKEVKDPRALNLGDIICIDFEGDGRFDHSLIVTEKDRYGMPLVNAHTTNSRHRYWTYEDSTRYTPQIVYKFFVILDGN